MKLGGGKHERKSLQRGTSRGSKIRSGFWLRPCYRDIIHCQPFDPLGNHPWLFGLAVCDLLCAVSVVATNYETTSGRECRNTSVVVQKFDFSIQRVRQTNF